MLFNFNKQILAHQIFGRPCKTKEKKGLYIQEQAMLKCANKEPNAEISTLQTNKSIKQSYLYYNNLLYSH